MAMEKHYVLKETHSRAITAIGHNVARREIVIGCEDGTLKSYECESGKLIQTTNEHRGWITNFLYWTDMKLLLSAANDGTIIAWSAGGGIFDKVAVGQPVYCMSVNPRRHQLVCGINGGIKVFSLDPEKESGHIINQKVVYVAPEHTDIVRCIVCHESRVYSAGFDQKMIIYDSSYTGNSSMEPIIVNHHAHDAGILCLILVRDNENNMWIVTGSFDKTVKIWSPDGKLVHRLDGFFASVTGVCYIPRNKTVWAVGGTSTPFLFDPKSGENVSDFLGAYERERDDEKYSLQVMNYFPDLNQVVASTSRRNLIVWKYNPYGCMSALRCGIAIESLAYTRKAPILLFSGDMEGTITKWERMQSNHFMYSKEFFPLTEAKKAKRKIKRNDNDKTKLISQYRAQQNAKNKVVSQYAYNKTAIPSVELHQHSHTTILKVDFVEELDVIVAACEDSNVYVWGFDESAVQALIGMKPEPQDGLTRQFSILLGADMGFNKNSDEDSVTNRVAGFVCIHILDDHTSCVTSLAVVGRDYSPDGQTYLITGGWDRRLLVWNLQSGELVTSFCNPSKDPFSAHVEMACDGIITSIAYCPSRNEFAYSSSDRMVYLRSFDVKGENMVLLNTLQGHYHEVTTVLWSPIKEHWITGSEDGTIRVWSSTELNQCEQVLSAQGAVSALCVDKTNGSIIAGVQEVIRVFDNEHYRMMQTNHGHTDAVRCIIHVKERSQYVTASLDQTIRIWNAWTPRRKKNAAQTQENQAAASEEAGEKSA